jgi:hypothetical protein
MRPPTVNDTKVSGDFPAAHSMDTEWFAADQLGQIAVFRTQEDGPMPVNVFGPVTAHYESWFLATLCRSGSSLSFELSGVVADGKVYECRYADYASNLVTATEVPSEKVASMPYTDEEYSLLWLTSDEHIQAIQGADDWYRVPSRDQVLVHGLFPAQMIAQFSERGWLRRAWLYCRLDPLRFGIFTYEYDGSMGPPFDPYTRTGVPTNALRVSDLVDTPRDVVAATTAPHVDFAQGTTVQVIEHFDCRGWRDAHLTVADTVDQHTKKTANEQMASQEAQIRDADVKVALGIVVSVVAAVLFAVLHARTNAWWNAPLCTLVGIGLYRLFVRTLVDRYFD